MTNSESAASRRTIMIAAAATIVIAVVVAAAVSRSRRPAADASHGDPTAQVDAAAEPDAARATVDPLRRPASEAELAIVRPLVAGGELAGWTIASIDVVREGAITLQVRRGEQAGRLEITLAGGEGAPLPPARGGAYAVYYGAEGVFLGSDAIALAEALAAVLSRNADVPVPPGLAPYRADPPPAR